MAKLIDMINYEFNGCIVLKRVKNKYGNAFWLCRCVCRNKFVVKGAYTRSGKTKSCGCLSRKLARDRLRKHGNRNTRLYNVWSNMKERCSNARS